MLWFTACTITLQDILHITFTGTKCICPLFFMSTLPQFIYQRLLQTHIWPQRTSGLNYYAIWQKRAAKFSVLIIFFRVFTCVCLCVYLWMHVCAFYRCWRLKSLGCADPTEHRCACAPAIPSPFHNREGVDQRNTVNIKGTLYTIWPITKKKVKRVNKM